MKTSSRIVFQIEPPLRRLVEPRTNQDSCIAALEKIDAYKDVSDEALEDVLEILKARIRKKKEALQCPLFPFRS